MALGSAAGTGTQREDSSSLAELLTPILENPIVNESRRLERRLPDFSLDLFWEEPRLKLNDDRFIAPLPLLLLLSVPILWPTLASSCISSSSLSLDEQSNSAAAMAAAAAIPMPPMPAAEDRRLPSMREW
eukprot:CAMPEP_0196152362 /NCGR_PEP_ID=MMETSP0910-20130528/35358_1 /TAXON_ID=49265 /ORGANISM="Thalassiosira rotula, Strain GSO102" /LENGTH=129 /DNA_ID=CAMNT_0041415937 /DNA_START=84 /DNA_END=470 /DNA_ORIENTATION=+